MNKLKFPHNQLNDCYNKALAKLVEHGEQPDPRFLELHVMVPYSFTTSSLGFDLTVTIDQQAYHHAYITCFNYNEYSIVFHGGKWAYTIKHPKQKFYKDIIASKITRVSQIEKYKRKSISKIFTYNDGDE